MAEKNSTLILKVDLECSRCRKEIGRVLFKLQGKENIKTISYDEKNNKVTISGPFDPERLSTKLTCRAGRVIKDIQIKEKEKPKETKPIQAAPAEKEKPKKEEKPAEKEKKPDKPAEKKPEKDEKPSKSEPEMPKKIEPVQVHQPTCCPAPYYEGYYGGCQCCMRGNVFGYAAAPPLGPYYAPPYDGYRVYHYSEEDPSTSSCNVM
ncbi:formin-A-like protein [Carex littledalei]|uniref:Formin-A-like protein n=1 Tax=Carex littledalei TaxID=544730 RepID=A0A833VWC7_9POAL|nr:formin-A-like protein [Carex littledalei]